MNSSSEFSGCLMRTAPGLMRVKARLESPRSLMVNRRPAVVGSDDNENGLFRHHRPGDMRTAGRIATGDAGHFARGRVDQDIDDLRQRPGGIEAPDRLREAVGHRQVGLPLLGVLDGASYVVNGDISWLEPRAMNALVHHGLAHLAPVDAH